MNWRNHITKPVKLVIWELDDTVWAGTLSEDDDVRLYSHVKKILAEFNKRGIMNVICSKNYRAEAVQKLQDFHLWEFFVWASIDHTPKGPRVKKMLDDLQILEENVLAIDHDAFNLLEIQFYNKRINLLHAGFMENLLKNPLLQGSQKAFIPLKQIDNMIPLQENFQSNVEFLKSIHIRITMVKYRPEYLERVIELINGTNKLNYSKKRMSRNEITELLSDDSITIRCIQEADDIGERGFVGFYAIKDDALVHFLFSARVLGMGIEQSVYSYLKNPHLEITGQTAVPLLKEMVCDDYIEVAEEQKGLNNQLMSSMWVKEDKGYWQRNSVYVIGACDMFNMTGNLAAPCNRIISESNTYKGNFRGVNVGTEYIRSNFEMNQEEKEFCKSHFYNYAPELAFRLQIFCEEYDYVIFSSYDEFLYQIYVNRTNPDIRVLRNHEPIIGEDNNILGPEESQEWLANHFYEPVFMDETRFYENLQWIRNRLSPQTILILVNGPEFDFYMLSNNPSERHNPELRERIIRLNKVLKQFASDNEQNVRLVDVNRILTKITHFTNNIFHWTHQKCFEIARECAKTMSLSPVRRETGFQEQYPVNGRKIVIWGSCQYAQICYYSLAANGLDIYAVCDHRPYDGDDFVVERAEILCGNQNQYYVLVIEPGDCHKIQELLCDYGYINCEDYILFPSATLLRTHTTVV